MTNLLEWHKEPPSKEVLRAERIGLIAGLVMGILIGIAVSI